MSSVILGLRLQGRNTINTVFSGWIRMARLGSSHLHGNFRQNTLNRVFSTGNGISYDRFGRRQQLKPVFVRLL
jgi:hypothetical protein